MMKSEETQTLIALALNQYKINVTCLSEVRLLKTGNRSIKVYQANVLYHIYHSGTTDNSRCHDVALVLSDKVNAVLLA